ncbi:MAG: ATP-binding cassette domain-containing protein [Desulfobacterales bacterium]
MRVELVDIHKHFGPVKANDGVNLTVLPGELHGILGENGAGKSTLMKILAGFTARTGGSVRVDGNPVDYRTTAAAVGLGVGMLYQDPLDFPQLPVIDNFILGQAGGVSLVRNSFKARFLELADSFHFRLNPEAPANSLTVGERQQVELLRLLALGIRLLILDEPTTGISSAQKELLYAALRRLAAEGKSVLLVSHKLEDVESLCDRVTVLRLGRVAGSMARPFDTQQLLKMMFGTAPRTPTRSAQPAGGAILVMDRVSCPGGRSGLVDCSVAIRRGEVVGLAGLEGSGQEVFLRVAAGLKKPLAGSVELPGQPVPEGNYHRFNELGVVFLPSARLEEGLIPKLTITEHVALREKRRSLRVPYRAAAEGAARRIRNFRIKGAPQTPVEELSGGNQQRLLLSFLPPDPRLLLLENPTRGLDLESVNWVWRHLHAYSRVGAGIVFSSPELDEILMVADRVLVFFNGQVVMDAAAAATDLHALGKAIAGKI